MQSISMAASRCEVIVGRAPSAQIVVPQSHEAALTVAIERIT